MVVPRYKKDKILSSLIQTAYLPAEVPPTVTARHFAEFSRKHYKALKSFKPDTHTQFEKFSVPRENGARRDLALVHPAAQLGVSVLLAENYEEIHDLISNTRISLYDVRADMDNYKAFKGVVFRELDLDKKRSDIARQKPFVLKADISKFFYTMYTHSIPWSVVGKEKIKERIFKKSKKTNRARHWTEQIDRALQLCQSSETFGIPVGPDTSRIIAEILLSGVHKDEELTQAIGDAPGFRVVDDFFLGFDNEEKCQVALNALRNALAKFNMRLNDEKTWIKPSREIFMDRWRYELIHTPIRSNNIGTQARSIQYLSEVASYHTAISSNGFPVKWAVQKLSKMKFYPNNFKLLLSTLLRFARDYPSCMGIVSTFIINNKPLCNTTETRTAIKGWVKSVFRDHAKHSNDFEVVWSLVVCGALKIKVSKRDFGDYSKSMCSVALAMLGLLNKNNLLVGKLSGFSWREVVKQSGLNGHHWLMYYESVLRGWTTDKDMIATVKADALLKQLLSNKITFLDDSIFGDMAINLERRRLIKTSSATRVVILPDEGSLGIASI